MATKSDGIQQLLVAEKKARDIVDEARKRKANRLRQAKDEAKREIDAFKAEKENTYKALEQQLLGSKSVTEDSAKQKTQQAISTMEVQFEQNRKAVLDDVLQLFLKIQPETHKNLNNQ